MIGEAADALDHALELQASPGALPRLRQLPVPDGVLLLIRIAAGDKEALRSADMRTSTTSAALTSTAVHYLKLVLFADETDPYRSLGVRNDASDDLIKEHYRWLMHWLHPDRDPQGATQALAQRVTGAWQVVRSSERRQTIDQNRRPRRTAHRVVPASTQRCAPPSQQSWPRSSISPRVLRLLPVLVLGGLAASALATLAAWHWLDAGPHANQDIDPRVSIGAAPSKSPAMVDATPVNRKSPLTMASVAAATREPMRPDDPAVTGHAASPDARSVATALTDASRGSQDARAAQARQDADAAGSDPMVGTNPRNGYAALPLSFSAAYAQGDLTRMMELFTQDAVDSGGRTNALEHEYDRLFHSSSWRRMRLYDWTWNVQNLRAIGSGTYEAWVARYGYERTLHLQGHIEIEAVPVADAWKIRRIALQEVHQ